MQSIFEILFLIGNPGNISAERKRPSKEKSNLLKVVETKGCWKLKYGESWYSSLSNFFEKKSNKIISYLHALLSFSKFGVIM